MAHLSVGIGEIQVSCCPDDAIVALGLGSCVAIVVHDRPSGTVGAVHAMLPSNRCARDIQEGRPGRYVDEGLHNLLNLMGVHSGHASRLTSAIVGGAAMFEFTGPSHLDIGKNNIEMSREMLRQLGIPLLASDVGGSQGRSMVVTVADASVRVRSVGSEKVLVSLATRRACSTVA